MLKGQGTSPGSPAGFLGSSGWGKHPPLLSCSSGLGSGRAPPACLSWPPGPPFYAPGTNAAGGWEPWRGGGWPGNLADSLCPIGQGNRPLAPLLLLLQGPSRLPLLISPASLLCPQGPTQPAGGFGGQGTGLGAQQAPHVWVGRTVTLHFSPALPGWPLSPATPDLPSPPPMSPGPT